ncbi:MAG TPA: methyl-accepting chemotaxis protein, partial [Rhodocyclaceae bacterium]|nr:methyl-accepting chemotaxis protein [Rhodocyclaceae bacterium]
NVTVPRTPDDVKVEYLDPVVQLWDLTNKNSETLLGQENALVDLSKNTSAIEAKNSTLLELSEQVAALKLQGGGSAREIAAANQLVMLTQRIAKNAAALQAGETISPESAFLLGKDAHSFRD